MTTRFVLSLSALLVFIAPALADWPQFLGPQRDGISRENVKLIRSFGEGQPKELWSVDVGVGFGAPAIQDGRVYFLDRRGETHDVMRCFDLSSGKQLWETPYEAPGKFDHPGSRTTPAVDGKYVFSVGPLGELYCFDKTDGKALWHKNIVEEFQGERPRWAVAQSPTLYKDWVIVAPCGKAAGVVAFEKATGKAAWKSEPIGTLGYGSPMVSKIDGVDQVVMVAVKKPDKKAESATTATAPATSQAGQGQQRGRRERDNTKCNIAGVDAATGKLLWSYDGWGCNNPIPSPTAIGDGRFFITAGYGAGSVMFRVGRDGDKWQAKELFKTDKLSGQIHNVLFYEGYLYANGNDNSRKDGLMCLDLDGNVKWQTGETKFDKGGLLIADGLLIVLDGNDGTLHLIDPSSHGFKELSQAKVLEAKGKQVWAPLVITDGKLLVRDKQQLKCLDMKAQQ